MRGYVIMKSPKTGKWLVVEKRYGIPYATADTREDAVKALAEIKASDKVEAERRRVAKAERQSAAEEKSDKLIIGKTAKTPDGRTYLLERNGGLEMRSRHCYTLTVDGECIFTSGTLEKATEYIFK